MSYEAPIEFYRKREKIYPRAVSGLFARLRVTGVVVLLGLFYGIPAYLLIRAALALSGAGTRGEQLLQAVRYHRLLWQLVAGMMVCVVLLYGLLVVGFVAAGAALESALEDVATELENVE